MATLGKTPLFGDTNQYTSGVILELVRAPNKNLSIPYNGALIQLNPTMTQIICSFNGTNNFENTFEKGSALIEECLDMLSVILGINLITKNINETSLVWWSKEGKRILHLQYFYIHNLNIEILLQLESRDAEGNVIPPHVIEPEHHAALRFFRLSQVTEDLFDAYRNMYLSFELILSSCYPMKRQESESKWLRRVVADIDEDIKLLDHIGMESIESFFQAIYTNARCNLFHAKSGKEYFLPTSNTDDREAIKKALTYLSQCVLHLLYESCDIRRRMGIRFSDTSNEKMLNNMMTANALIFSNTSDTDNDYKIQPDDIKYPADVSINNQFAKTTCNVDCGDTLSSLTLRSIYLVDNKETHLTVELDTPLSLTGIDCLEVEINLEITSGNQSKHTYKH